MSEALYQFMLSHPRLFVLTGAGCSTAAGLGDYRDADGQWKRPQPITGQSFINDTHARKRYWARSAVGWPGFSAARPAAAHHALANADAVLVAGSSLMVFSGFRFCLAAANNGQPNAIVNHGKTRADDMATIKVSGDVGDNLKKLARMMT